MGPSVPPRSYLPVIALHVHALCLPFIAAAANFHLHFAPHIGVAIIAAAVAHLVAKPNDQTADIQLLQSFAAHVTLENGALIACDGIAYGLRIHAPRLQGSTAPLARGKHLATRADSLRAAPAHVDTGAVDDECVRFHARHPAQQAGPSTGSGVDTGGDDVTIFGAVAADLRLGADAKA